MQPELHNNHVNYKFNNDLCNSLPMHRNDFRRVTEVENRNAYDV